MKLAVWFVAALLIGAACGGGSGTNSDAPVDTSNEGPPTGFTFAAIGDRSFASFGWTGVIHNLRVPDGTPFGVKATQCNGSDGICSFEGPTEPVSSVRRRRCLNRMSKPCDTDNDCPADGTTSKRCVYIYDPPTATPLTGAGGKVGACGWSYVPIAPAGMPPTISGTLDQTSGELNITNLNILLPLNGSAGTYRGACSECIGDVNANDGVKDGTCVASQHGDLTATDPSPDLGQKCDVHRYGSIPGYEGSYSMDCSPTVRTGDAPPTTFGGTFTSSGYQVSISAASPDCTDPRFAGQKCFCGMCPDGVKACLSNADCGGAQCGALPATCNPNPAPFDDNGAANSLYDPAFLPNQCRGAGMGALFATANNSCVNRTCNWNAAEGLGTCKSTLTGETLGCYPSGLGASIVAPGGVTKQGKVWIVDTATARCTRSFPAAAAANNSQLGLPGLTFQKRSFRIITEHAQ